MHLGVLVPSAPSIASAVRRGLALVSLAVATAPALASAAPADPAANFPLNAPPKCWSAGTSPACINAAITSLNQARASLGQPPYALPTTFAALAPDQQVLVLSNLDRALYGLAPITGLTDQLSADAVVGAQNDQDPTPTSRNYRGWASNWAGGYGNILSAYEGWMYDDGVGSGNIDCRSAGDPGCWGHRHNVLIDFGSNGGLAMGVAATLDTRGDRSYSQLLFAGNAGYQPTYGYTWAQAVADGAGAGDSASAVPAAPVPAPAVSVTAATVPQPGTSLPASATNAVGQPTTPHITVVSRRHRTLMLSLTGPAGVALECSLTRRGQSGARAFFQRCTATTRFRNLRPGRYIIRVRSEAGTARLAVRVTR